MKKELSILISLGLVLPLLVLAAIVIDNPLNISTFVELIDNILNFIFWIATALFPLMIVIAGFYFMTSAGDPKRIETAKNIILYTIVGFIIILSAKGLINFLDDYFRGSSGS